MIDNTSLFRACAKAVQVRLKKPIASVNSSASPSIIDNATSVYCARAKEIVKNVAELRNFLIANRKEYVNVNHVTSIATGLSNFDRDRIDSDVEQAIRNTNRMVRTLKESIKADANLGATQFRHLQAVVELIEKFLRAVCKLHSEQRAVRVKKATDMKRMSRLATLVGDGPPSTPISQESTRLQTVEPTVATDDTTTANDNATTNVRRRKPIVGLEKKIDDVKRPRAVVVPDANEQRSTNDQHNEPLVENQQLLEENERLFQKANLIVNEIELIEGRVIEISRLQQVFTDKILEQEGCIMHIHTTAIGATLDLKSGNEQILKALQNKAGMRLWILFFLIVLTFTLLFLDWYNA